MKSNLTKENSMTNFIATGILIVALVGGGLMFGLPLWSVWQQGLAGEAELARATQARQIQIEQAKAESEAADYIVSAIQKVGAAAKEFPEYRKQIYIQAFSEALQEGLIDQIIYVPTEANIPIMEAGRAVE